MSSQGRRHNVSNRLLTHIAFAIMDHSKAVKNKAFIDPIQPDMNLSEVNYKFDSYLWPDSWAIVKARPRPVSSLIVQLRYLLHIPLIGAKPEIETMNGWMDE